VPPALIDAEAQDDGSCRQTRSRHPAYHSARPDLASGETHGQ